MVSEKCYKDKTTQEAMEEAAEEVEEEATITTPRSTRLRMLHVTTARNLDKFNAFVLNRKKTIKFRAYKDKKTCLSKIGKHEWSTVGHSASHLQRPRHKCHYRHRRQTMSNLSGPAETF